MTDDQAARMDAIRAEIQKLNLEAEQILLANTDPHPQGRGACQYNVCPCASYVSGGAPGICNRSRCGHPASSHAF